MKSFLSTAAIAALSLLCRVQAQTPTVSASALGLKSYTLVGCYSTGGSLKDQGSWTFQAMGNCQPLCVEQKLPVLALTGGTNCLCGNSVPANAYKVDNSSCNTPCNGYPNEMCGGDGFFMVYNDGLEASVSTDGVDSVTTGNGAPVSTIYVTPGGSTPSAEIIYQTSVVPSSSSGSSKAAIAAGVVVGITVLAAAVGGLLFFLRQRKRKELEEEMRRHDAVATLVRGEKAPSTTSDSRLEPSVFSRRMSDGSIADNHDYSRRILKVANPDR